MICSESIEESALTLALTVELGDEDKQRARRENDGEFERVHAVLPPVPPHIPPRRRLCQCNSPTPAAAAAATACTAGVGGGDGFAGGCAQHRQRRECVEGHAHDGNARATQPRLSTGDRRAQCAVGQMPQAMVYVYESVKA
jgi:hypothetical protein